MLFDTHMHTVFSTDSKMELLEAIKRAQELNIGIIITEHMDLSYPEPLAFIFDVNKYFEQYEPFRNDKVLLGIEIGMRQDCLEQNNEIVTNHPLDCVIGSIHVIDNIDLYCSSFYRSRTKKEVYSQYFAYMLECVKKYEFIDTLGHIDYICRYAQYEDTQIDYEEFKDYIDPILTTIITNGKAIEINTRRLNNKANIQKLIPIYKRFKELGGKWVTIGSDAHKVQDIGMYMSDALELARMCKLIPVYFKKRQPVPYRL